MIDPSRLIGRKTSSKYLSIYFSLPLFKEKEEDKEKGEEKMQKEEQNKG